MIYVNILNLNSYDLIVNFAIFDADKVGLKRTVHNY